MRRTGLFVAVALVLLAMAPPARADIADLYLRKIRHGEKTFYQAGGWQHWRNRWEVFWEPNYYGVSGSWLAGEDVGALVLLSKPRSQLQLTVFTLESQLAEASGDHALVFAYLPFFAPFIPQIVENGPPVSQGMTGAQLRVGDWLETAYGVVTGFVPGQPGALGSFVEANLPLAYLRTSALVDNATAKAERSQVTFRYDEAKWAHFLEVGRVVSQDNPYWLATVDRLGGWFSSDLRMTEGMSFGYVQAGLHVATGHVASHKAVGKFGFACDFQLYGNLIDPHAFVASAPDEVKPGFTAEFYFQMPSTDWLAVLDFLLGAQTAAMQQRQGNYEAAQKTENDAVKNSEHLMKIASEDDRVYGGLTLGVSYNDPTQLRNYGAYNDWYLYLHFRLFY